MHDINQTKGTANGKTDHKADKLHSKSYYQRKKVAGLNKPNEAFDGRGHALRGDYSAPKQHPQPARNIFTPVRASSPR